MLSELFDGDVDMETAERARFAAEKRGRRFDSQATPSKGARKKSKFETVCGETKDESPDDDVHDDLAPLSARLRRTSIKPAVRGGLLDLGDGFPSDDESLANSNDSTEANDNLESFGAVRSNGDDDDDDDDEDEDDDEEEGPQGIQGIY